MALPRISLQTLDAFERVAQSGSVQVAAAEMGLSISSVSHHISRLEAQIGVTLFDRGSRPFRLTREGRQALEHLSRGLSHIRRATSETMISGLIGTRSLRIGIVEEFESTVTPQLAAFLAGQMPRATLSIGNVLSHAAPGMLQKGEIDLAIVADSDGFAPATPREPLLRDPFVAALPEGTAPPMRDQLDRAGPAFLRFNPAHQIGRQIEAHLARNRVDLPGRLVFDSVQSIMAIVAAGAGWSVITPLGFTRAERLAARVRLHPLPLPAFSRRIVLASRDSFDAPTRAALAALLRQIIDREVIAPVCAGHPWLADQLVTTP